MCVLVSLALDEVRIFKDCSRYFLINHDKKLACDALIEAVLQQQQNNNNNNNNNTTLYIKCCFSAAATAGELNKKLQKTAS